MKTLEERRAYAREKSAKWRAEHPERAAATARAWHNLHRERVRELRDRWYKQRREAETGITADHVERKRAEQAGRCAICDETPKVFHADHDHLRRIPRGLLCNRCNMGLGLFRDNPALLGRAAAYLGAYLPAEVGT